MKFDNVSATQYVPKVFATFTNAAIVLAISVQINYMLLKFLVYL